MNDTKHAFNERISIVRAEDTAAAWGDEFPSAASTPFLLAQAELASHAAVSPQLADGEITVGTTAAIEHVGASRVGATLRTVAALQSRTGRRLRFTIEVHDGDRIVALVSHERAIVRRSAVEAALEQS